MTTSSDKTAELILRARELTRSLGEEDPLRELLSGLAEAAARSQSMFENAVQAMYAGTLDGRILDANPAMAAILGYPSLAAMLPMEDFAGKHYMVPESRAALVAELRERGVVLNREVSLKRLDGTPVWGLANIRLFCDADGRELIEGITVDITARKSAEEALAASERRLRRILETAGEGFLYMDLDMVIQDVNEALCRLLGRAREEILGRTTLHFATPEFGDFLRRNRDRLLGQDYRTFEGSLLRSDGRTVPVLIHGNILRCADQTPIGNVAFVSDLSEQKKALALAAQVQQGLMPSGPPRFDGLEVAGRSVPSQYAGGDYFDYLEESPDGKGFFRAVVGDVTGHGLDAALFMATARGFLRMRSAQPGSLDGVVADLNAHLARDTMGSGRFMTLMLMEFRPSEGVRWVRAGHDPAILYDPLSGEFTEFLGPGMALGVLENAAYQESHAPWPEPGQVLALGTDGIWEARNASGEMFGKERYRDSLKSRAGQGASAILDGVFEDLRAFAGPVLEDDATLMVVKVRPEPPG